MVAHSSKSATGIASFCKTGQENWLLARNLLFCCWLIIVIIAVTKETIKFGNSDAKKTFLNTTSGPIQSSVNTFEEHKRFEINGIKLNTKCGHTQCKLFQHGFIMPTLIEDKVVKV